MAAGKVKRARPRPGETVQRILATTKEILLEQGASDINVRRVCKEANISRATFYRYFGSKEELLEALVKYERERFDRLIDENTSGCETTRDRLMVYFVSIGNYLVGDKARRFFEGEPKFFIEHFKRIFPKSVERTMEVLAPAFDDWDRRLDAKLDRKFVAEMLVRYMLSYVWIPDESEPREFFRRLESCLSMFSALGRDGSF